MEFHEASSLFVLRKRASSGAWKELEESKALRVRDALHRAVLDDDLDPSAGPKVRPGSQHRERDWLEMRKARMERENHPRGSLVWKELAAFQ
jgi:hypothetical protein